LPLHLAVSIVLIAVHAEKNVAKGGQPSEIHHNTVFSIVCYLPVSSFSICWMMMMMCCDVTVYALPQQAAETGNYFNGCVRSLRINGQLVDWHAADELFGMHVSGCPVAEDDVYYA